MTENAASDQEQEKKVQIEDESQHMGALLDAEGLNLDFPKAGEIRDGMIASLSEGQILVSVGAKSEGIITGKEYEAIPASLLDTLKVGNSIPVFVITPEDSNGNLVLSFTKAVEEQAWTEAEALMKAGDAVDSTIISFNKGGLIVPLSTIRGFIPASQLSMSRRLSISGETPEAKYKEMIGQPIKVNVIEVDRERHRLILSERSASNETRDMIRDKVMEDLNEGDIKTGRITSLADFGAFVSIGGADGLVHLSECSWDHINHPSEILKVGDEVRVKIISIDRDRKRIGLSIRQLKGDPWADHVASLKVGQLVQGEITRLTNFGAFARLDLPGDLEGLIHVSEISDKRIEHPKEVLKVGEKVSLRIIKIEDDTHRIGLSMRKVDSPAFADQDWKSLAADFDLTAAPSEGESLATHLGQELETAKVEEAEAPKAEEKEADAAEAAEEVAEKATEEEKPAE
ncbi:MAG: S1 RNA-binding domain-containing protein [Anaerolineaceae bacterium]|nr:S1 RNA-binding domain-containing protein [Anaerolineaceae bacterium]